MSYYPPRPHTPAPVYCARCQSEIALHRAPLTDIQARLYAYIRDRIAADGYAPSFGEIAREFGYRSLATVHEHLRSLERKGYITRGFNEARAIALVAA